MNSVVGKARKGAASACNDRLNLVGRRKLLNAREDVVNSIWGKHVGIENKGIKRVEKRRWGLTAFQEKACQGRAFQTEAFRGKANVLQGTAFSTPLPETPLPDTLFPNTLLPDTFSSHACPETALYTALLCRSKSPHTGHSTAHRNVELRIATPASLAIVNGH